MIDPLSALLAGLAACGINIAAIIGGYVRIAERLTRLETQVAQLMLQSLHHRAPDYGRDRTPED